MEIEWIIAAVPILIAGVNFALYVSFKTESFSREYEGKNQRIVDSLFVQLKDSVDKLNKKTKGIKAEDLKSVLPELKELSRIGSKIGEWGAHISAGKAALWASAGAAFFSAVFFSATCLLYGFDQGGTRWQLLMISGLVAFFVGFQKMREYRRITKSIDARSEDLNMGRSILDALKKEEEDAEKALLA
jgi:hypothetical protein